MLDKLITQITASKWHYIRVINMTTLQIAEVAPAINGLHPNGQTRIKDAADIIGVHHQTLRRWWKSGRFMKPTNINGILLFKNSDLIAWVEQQHSDSEVNHEK